MKKYYKKHIRRFIFWAFKERIRVFACQKVFSKQSIEMTNPDYLKDRIKNEIIHEMAKKMFEEGFIEIEEKSDTSNGYEFVNYTTRLYCLK